MAVTVPTYAASMALGGANSGVLIVNDPVHGLVNVGTVGGGPFMDAGMVDVSGRLMGFTTKRGRQDAWSGVNAGTVTAILDDHDGAFDPENASSPYYPNVKIRRRINVTATWNSVVYGLGVAYANSYQAAPDGVINADVTVNATDLFQRLNNRDFTVHLPAQTVGARIHSVLDVIQWPKAARIIDGGRLTVPPANLDKYKMLAHVNDILLAERGLFWVDGSGNAVYRDRAYRQGKNSRGTFGAGGLAIRKVYPDFSDAGIINEVKCQRTGGVEQVARDAVSIADYDIVSYKVPTQSADMLPSDQEAGRLCSYLVSQRAQPNNRITKIEIEPEADPTNLWPLCLGLDIGERITIAHNLAGTKGVTAQDYFIESVSHDWKLPEGTHVTTWELSLAPTTTWLIVNDATRGLVNVNSVGW